MCKTCIYRPELPATIPMRGNESLRVSRTMRPLSVATIPMRGNEDQAHAGIGRSTWATIPMRGNEISFVAYCANHSALGYDPHEG